MNSELKSIMAEIWEWQQKTFPETTPQGSANHLLLEAKELAVDPYDPLEIADVLMLAMECANLQGYDIAHILQDKHKINLNREWEKASGGFSLHVRDKK